MGFTAEVLGECTEFRARRRAWAALDFAEAGLHAAHPRGVCWDNALAESFFATDKLELIEPAT